MATRRASSVMVGRGAELAALDAAVADCADRPLTLVAGEAGVGKTRLVAEYLARRSSGLTIVGSCIDLGADHVPYAPFVDALGRYVECLAHVESAGDLPADLRAAAFELGAIVPDAAVLAPRPLDGIDGSQGGRGRLYEAVRTAFDQAPEPMACVLEDLHWADRSSLELLVYLARRLRRGRTAIVATFRTDDLSRRHPLVPVLAELERSGRTTRIDVGRLERDQVAALVREIRGDVPEDLVATIARRSEGVPFLAEELLALDARPGEPVPATLRELLLARLAPLTDRARGLIAIVAVVERPADAELLEIAWDGTQQQLDTALRDAIGRGLLVVDPSTGRVAFRHALLGEAVADDLLPGERVRLHAKIARVLVARPDLARPTAAGAAAEVAHHLFRAHDFEAALRASVTAGDAAAAARAHAEARELYERALELVELVPDGARRAGIEPTRLLDAAAEASFHAGDLARAVALGARAVQLAEPTGDSGRTGYLLGRLVEWTELSGDFDRVAELAERAVALVSPQPPSLARAYALIGLAAARGHAGRARECLELAREAVDVAVACGATAQEAVARSNAAAALSILGRDAEAVEEIERAAVLSDVSRGTEEITVTQTDRAVIRASARRFADLGQVLDAVRTALDREGSLEVHEPWVAAPETELLEWEGRWAEAEMLASAHIARQVPTGPRAAHLLMRGRLRARTGRLDEAEADLGAVLEIRPTAEPEARAAALGVLAEIALLRADAGRGLALIDEALALLAAVDELPIRIHLLALGLEAAADDRERSAARRDDRRRTEVEARAQRFAGELAAAAAGTLIEGGGVEDRVTSRVAWGLAEAARCRGDARAADWAAAAAALDASGEPYLSRRCRLREAEAVLTEGRDRPVAQTLLREAAAWAERVGCIPLAASITALARRARLDLSSPAEPDTGVTQRSSGTVPQDPYGLSEREREVLALLVDGRTNREIGGTLFISEKTASVHVTHILDKLGVASRGAAAALAARAHLVGDGT